MVNASQRKSGRENTNPEDSLDDLDLLIEEETKTDDAETYQSPIMKKSRHEQLSTHMLREEVPHIQAAKNYLQQLADDGRDTSPYTSINQEDDTGEHGTKKLAPAQKTKLLQLLRRSEQAKEKLFIAALPLIKIIANKEWKRRQQWGSTVSYEDLVQDATVGFLKGLDAFKIESIDKSSTNYLGQWMLVEMRRSSEVMDHDLQVGNEAGERFRKIRALRTRLIHDLGREPTDKEIAEASRNPDYVTRPVMVGRVQKSGENHPVGKGVTEKQVQLEREVRERVGFAARFVSTDSDKDSPPPPGTLDPERTKDTSMRSQDPAEKVADDDSRRIISELISYTIREMGLPHEQSTIIALRFGLPPNRQEKSVREISSETGVSRARITKVVNAFAQEMSMKGGIFHRHLQRYPVEDLLSVELGWILDILGPWNPSYDTQKTRTVSSILTSSPKPRTDTMFPPAATADRSAQPHNPFKTETQAWFRCGYHERMFSRLYENRQSVPRTSACPACGKDSPLVRTQ